MEHVRRIRPIERLLIFLIFTCFGFWNVGVIITGKLASNEPFDIKHNILDEMTAAYCGLGLLPILLWFFRRFPLGRKNAASHIPLYIGASLVYAGIWISLIYLTRSLLYPLLDQGTYRFGRFQYQYVMENLKMMTAFWAIYGVTAYFKAARGREQEKVRASQLEERLTRARLQALQAQLHPHFLFNTLNAVSSAMYEDVDAADRMLANLSDLLRITLTSDGRTEHTLEDELKIMGLYVEIMQARFGDSLSIRQEIAADTLHARVPSFILQPLVENAINHSGKDDHRVEIIIRTERESGRLIIRVLDNGPGIPGDPGDALKGGIGLSNTAERLEKLYGGDQDFYLSNRDEGGLMVAIEIPWRSSSGESGRDG